MDLKEALVHSPRAAASVAWFTRQDERPRIEQTIATEAAIRNDAHLVKYTWACLDAAAQDPTHAPLFHAAARNRLMAIREKPATAPLHAINSASRDTHFSSQHISVLSGVSSSRR